MYRLSRDVCFLNLTETPKLYDIIRIIRDYPNVTLLRAFTKSYAMAGVRLGYTLSGDRDFLVEMSRCVSCLNVSTLAQTAEFSRSCTVRSSCSSRTSGQGSRRL